MDSGIVFVTTPIGNLADISLKSLEILKQSSLVYCEDTRKTKDLLKRLEIGLDDKEFYSFHDHSSDEKLNIVLNQARIKKVVYVSDAGSPLVSDPAFPLVLACIEKNISFDFCSGITAPVAALELSGLAPLPYTFHGFLPREGGKIKEKIRSLGQGTHIFFEGVSRVIKTLKLMTEVLPDENFVVARELTKTHQQVYRFKGREFDSDVLTTKGEFVILLHKSDALTMSSDVVKVAREIMDQGSKPKLVAKLLGEILGENSKEIYQKLGRN